MITLSLHAIFMQLLLRSTMPISHYPGTPMKRSFGLIIGSLILTALTVSALAQPPGGPGGGGPFGGGPGMMRQTRKIIKDFDKNDDGWHNQEERADCGGSLK